MTIDEAKSILFDMLGDKTVIKSTKQNQAILTVFKALEQKPMLDKIRAEIEKLKKICDKSDLNSMEQYSSAFGMVLDILDKYKRKRGIRCR